MYRIVWTPAKTTTDRGDQSAGAASDTMNDVFSSPFDADAFDAIQGPVVNGFVGAGLLSTPYATAASVQSFRVAGVAISAPVVLDAGSLPAGFGDVSAAVGGAQAQAQYGVIGSGIKIGIISDAFSAISGDVATAVADGAIGSYTIVKDDPSASTDEGLAMAEIIHSIAPGAQIYFYSGDFGESDFAQGINTLAQDGANIIIDDESYLTEPFYQQGAPISAAIDNVVQNDKVVYMTAAGNAGPSSFYEGHFNSSTSFATTLAVGSGGAAQGVTAFNFGTTASPSAYEAIAVPSGLQGNYSSIDLQWDQPFQSISGTGSGYSLQFYLFDSNHQLVVNTGYGPVQGYGAAGNGTGDDVGQDPVQWNLFLDNPGTYYLAIVENGGSIPVGQDQFKVIISDDAGTPIGFSGANAGVGTGTVYGHAMDPNAITVGAVPYTATPAYGVSPPQIESFSSSGPGEFLLNASGQQITNPVSDGKVNLSAPDGNPTTLPSSEGLDPFYGTSAATPAAAAIAALMLQENPSLTPAQVEALLAQSAIPMSSPTESGAGLVQAVGAVGLAQQYITPTVAVSISGSKFNVAHPTGTVTFTFSAAPTAFTLADTSAVGGSLSALSGSGTSYTATFTAAVDTDITGASVSVTAGSWHEANGTSGAGGSTSAFTVDTVVPTVAVAVNSTDVNIANPTATVTFTFNKAPADFSLADVTATDGTLSNLSGSGTTYSATFTASPKVEATNATVAVTGASYHDADGNAGLGATTPAFTVDMVAPTVTIANAGGLTNQVSQTISGTVTGTPAAVGTTVTLYDNGSATALGTATVGTGGAWSTSVTLTGDGTHSIVAKDTDTDGNTGSSSPVTFTLQTSTTLVAVTATPSSGTESAGQTVALTLAMSHAVSVSGGIPTLALNDGGTADYNAAATAALGDPTKLVFDYTVATTDHDVTGLAIVGGNPNGASILDAAGNIPNFAALFATFPNLDIAPIPPATVTAVSASPSGGIELVGQTMTLTVTMSKAVSVSGGAPTLILNDGGTATYSAAETAALNDPTKLVFSYTVASSDLNVSALAIVNGNPNGATVVDSSGNIPNFAGVFATFPGISVATSTVVKSVAASPAAGIENPGQTIVITLAMNDDVTVSGGTPTLALNTGGTASYNATATAALHDPTKLVFDYTVGATDQTVNTLAIVGGSLNGANILDVYGKFPNFAGALTSFPGLGVDPPSGAALDPAGSGASAGASNSVANSASDPAGIDFSSISFGAQTTLAYATNQYGTGGTLTVSDRTHTATIALLGQFIASDFQLASDFHGGTIVADPALTGAASTSFLASPHT